MLKARYKKEDKLLWKKDNLYDYESLNNMAIAIYNEHSDKEVWGAGDFFKHFEPVGSFGQPESTPNHPNIGLKREFDTGATRDTDEGKLDFEGFFSPSVMLAFAEYMNRNRKMADGSVRDSDNWQKGIPKDAYMKSMWRHFFDVWQNHRGISTHDDDITNLSALMFNVMGMLHEKLKDGKTSS